MKARLFLCSMLLFASFASFAQEEKSFSLELGTGFAPLHSLVSGVRSLKGSLASEGQTVSLIYSPTFALSGVWRINSRSEWLVTGGVTWDYYNVLQYGTFGIDPDGNPRYDLSSEALPAGRKNGDLSASITIRYRRIWNFEKPFERRRSCARDNPHRSKILLDPFPTISREHLRPPRHLSAWRHRLAVLIFPSTAESSGFGILSIPSSGRRSSGAWRTDGLQWRVGAASSLCL